MSTKTVKKKYEEIHFVDSTKPVWNYSLFTEEEISNFQQGTHYSLYKLFGNKQITALNTPGTYFAVWAPNAAQVSVIGDFNGWNAEAHPLRARGRAGIWEGFIADVDAGSRYK